MGFLGNMFSKKAAEGTPITLEISESGFAVNGVSFPLPASVSELTKALGEPRVAENQHMPQVMSIYCEKYGFNPEVYNPMEYYWDDMGIFVCSHDGETAHSLFISLGKCKYPFPMPKCCFSGSLFIGGKPWEEAVMRDGRLRSAVPFEKHHTLRIGSYGRQTRASSVRVLELALMTAVQEELFRSLRI